MVNWNIRPGRLVHIHPHRLPASRYKCTPALLDRHLDLFADGGGGLDASHRLDQFCRGLRLERLLRLDAVRLLLFPRDGHAREGHTVSRLVHDRRDGRTYRFFQKACSRFCLISASVLPLRSDAYSARVSLKAGLDVVIVVGADMLAIFERLIVVRITVVLMGMLALDGGVL